MNTPHSSKQQPYRIEVKAIPERYARGWHCIGLADSFGEQPVALDYFSTKLVAYRGEDGRAVVLDAYCPHMGADLTLGRVEGNSLRCPFHAWRWGADGVCDDIPYAKRIPAKAVIKSWQTLEENQLLFIWHDPEGNGPTPEHTPPRIDDCFSAQWSGWQLEKLRIDSNARELIDNMADVAHFGPIHGAGANRFKNIVQGVTYTQQMSNDSASLAEAGELQSDASYVGPAYLTSFMSGQMEGRDVASRLLIAHVPINTQSFELLFGVNVRKDPTLTDAQNQAMVDSYVEKNREAFYQDVAIWKTKTRIDNPLMCDGDGPINLLRQWYDQFYQDVAEVGDRWQQRREVVVDFHWRDV